MKTFIKFQNLFVTTLIVLLFTTSCERGQENTPAEAMQGIALQDMLAEEEYWEGNKLEYQDNFFTKVSYVASLIDQKGVSFQNISSLLKYFNEVNQRIYSIEFNPL